MSNGRIKIQVFCAGGIFPALERGVIDTAEFVGPFLDRRLGLQKAEQYCCTTGWHESATVSAPLVNEAACDRQPADLRAIVENACAACNVISQA
jgi:TRAP-type mannitol/chloroaromatic compound transport system substrate-binding protein